MIFHLEAAKGSLTAHLAAIKANENRKKKKLAASDDPTQPVDLFQKVVATSAPKGTSNKPTIVTFADGTQAISKKLDSWEATNEQFAYDLSQALGFDDVPYTNFKATKAAEFTSRQRFLTQVKGLLGDGEGDGWLSSVTDVVKGKAKGINYQSLEEMGVLDILTGNQDRHGHNIMVGNDGKIWAIDNGLMSTTGRGIFRGSPNESEPLGRVYLPYGTPNDYIMNRKTLSPETIGKLKNFVAKYKNDAAWNERVGKVFTEDTDDEQSQGLTKYAQQLIDQYGKEAQ